MPEGWDITTIAIIFGSALLLGVSFLLFSWYALIAVAVLVGLLGLFSLFVAKTGPGKKIGEKIGVKLMRTRLGGRLMRSQLRAAARKAGVPLKDPTGRPRSDIEIQLDLYDTPETRQIKQQLRGLNPAQRAQMLRMLESQSEAARRGDTDLVQAQAAARGAQMPRVSGRPVQGQPRSRARKKRRR